MRGFCEKVLLNVIHLKILKNVIHLKMRTLKAFTSHFFINFFRTHFKVILKISFTVLEMESALTCSDFLEWSVNELKYYLAVRGLSQVGLKLDLAARALAAYERKEPLRQDLKELERSLKIGYSNMLCTYGIPDPREIGEWKEDVSLWPHVDLGKIFAFVIEKKAFDTEYIGQYKARKAYSYFMSGFVHKLFVHQLSGDKILLKGKVTPSQKLSQDPRQVWVLCHNTGNVLCGYCTCTAGFAECCNHVVALLYKVECANSKGMIDPACTDVACSWNVSTQRNVRFMKIKDVEIRKHEVTNKNKKRVVQSDFKKSFDPRPLDVRGHENERLGQLFQQLRDAKPSAAVLKCIDPPRDYDCPPSLWEIADEILAENDGKDEQELIHLFSNSLSFNENQLKELERTTRAQGGSQIWRDQRVGCITATKIKDVCTKVQSIAKSRGKKIKVTPLLARLFKDKDISALPAVKYGREHETDAKKAFGEHIVKKHQNGRLLDSGLVASHSFPFIRATPDSIFTCKCCDGGKVPVEYKCSYKLRDKCVLDAFKELDYLEEREGKICLSKSHKYYSQVTTQTALLGANYAFFVVWTPIGDPFIEKIDFDSSHWAELERNAKIFFKSYVVSVLLKRREILFCATCENPCLEPEEMDGTEGCIIECSTCLLWHHWSCVDLSTSPKGDWICNACISSAMNDSFGIC